MGKEIYEGDLIRYHDIVLEVWWCEGKGCFMVEEEDYESGGFTYLLGDLDLLQVSILGNIHEK